MSLSAPAPHSAPDPHRGAGPLPRACVIGAGSSGIAAAKVLAERGFDFDCFELSDRVGGNWVWGNRNGVSSSYRSLHINTSRSRMQFSDFPMPDHLPNFARHDQIAAYFDAYVDHFGFRDRITFNTGVDHVTPEGYLRLTPYRAGTDGFFAAVLERSSYTP